MYWFIDLWYSACTKSGRKGGSLPDDIDRHDCHSLGAKYHSYEWAGLTGPDILFFWSGTTEWSRNLYHSHSQRRLTRPVR